MINILRLILLERLRKEEGIMVGNKARAGEMSAAYNSLVCKPQGLVPKIIHPMKLYTFLIIRVLFHYLHLFPQVYLFASVIFQNVFCSKSHFN
jgi:hypothetical protein